jgi:hypothetical protein
MISVTSSGSFKNTDRKLAKLRGLDVMSILKKYGQDGVNALSAATPKDSANTAAKWSYEVVRQGKTYKIIWSNSNIQEGVPVVILLQYGHATGTGGYVQGRDFINPAMKPIFDQIERDVWKVVTNA